MVSVDVKQHWTMLTIWSQFVPNMSTRHLRTLSYASSQIGNRTRPRAPVQNQHTRELIRAWKTSHKYNNKDPSCLRELSPGICVNTRYTNSTRGISSYPHWGCTSGRVYVPCISWRCTSCGLCVPCIYMHARWVIIGDSGLCCCTCVTYFKDSLTPLCVDSTVNGWMVRNEN